MKLLIHLLLLLKIFLIVVLINSCSSPTGARNISLSEFPLNYKSWVYEVVVDGAVSIDSIVNVDQRFIDGYLVTQLKDLKLFHNSDIGNMYRYQSVENGVLYEFGYGKELYKDLNTYLNPVPLVNYDNPVPDFLIENLYITNYSHGYELLNVDGEEVDIIRTHIKATSSSYGIDRYYSDKQRDLYYYISSRGIEKIVGYYDGKECNIRLIEVYK